MQNADSETDQEKRFEQAAQLDLAGEFEAARDAYIAVLTCDPTHLNALNNLGSLLHARGYLRAAERSYRQAIATHPNDARAYVNLANMALRDGEFAQARDRYEAALRIDAGERVAHRGLAYALGELGLEGEAAVHRDLGYGGAAFVTEIFRGSGAPIQVLVLASALGGQFSTDAFLDERIFAVTRVYLEYVDPAIPWPAHHLVLNAIGDADRCASALRIAERILARSAAPIINHPSSVMRTTRLEHAQRLGRIPGVRTARTLQLSRESLQCSDAALQLERERLLFPLVVRAPGFHAGRYCERVDDLPALQAAIACMPGERFLIAEFLDVRDADGHVRKYRVCFIDGTLYPAHLAIARDWKIHRFRSDSLADPAHREEEGRFFADPQGVVAAPAWSALERVRDAVHLAYAGIDFSLDRQRNVVLFEANAAMLIARPEAGEEFAYRVAPLQRISAAMRAALLRRAFLPRGEPIREL